MRFSATKRAISLIVWLAAQPLHSNGFSVGASTTYYALPCAEVYEVYGACAVYRFALLRGSCLITDTRTILTHAEMNARCCLKRAGCVYA